VRRHVSFHPADHWSPQGRDRQPQTTEGLLGHLCAHFGVPGGVLTALGRDAISAVLRHLGVTREDEVWIVTTFGVPNVSSHVTSTIFNHCKPSRVLTDRTRAIFAIHEFGVPIANTPELGVLARERGIPLIEDCAHTLDSRTPEWRVGTIGDYVVLSFSKIFPTMHGGALLGPPVPYEATPLTRRKLEESARVVGELWPRLSEFSHFRRESFRGLVSRFERLGLKPLYEITDSITPWFFPVSTPRWEAIIASANQRGVDCSVWHGSDIVVFPLHQYLDDEDLDLIAESAAA
jgi:hypothetical protein